MNPKALLSILLIFYPSAILGFTTTLSASSTTTSLFAKKQQKKNKSSASTAKSAGGFGNAPKKPTSDGKVRTVSGFTGSGTKPLRVAANTFDKLREDYGKDYTSDVYCKSPLNDPELLWFVGKINIRPDTAATPEQAVIAQKRLILEYAKRELRPQNLGGKYASSLELWLAPGDSEMDAVQNKVSLAKVDGSVADLCEDFSVNDVGYNPEIYVGDEAEKGGLRIKRDDDGNPIKEVFEINQ
ncbi:MAG: hypothetical protein SGBAC_008408 [Bacillariaceae sp.]